MTEKEKMQLGMLYYGDSDKELIEERKKAKSILFEYNNTHPTDTVKCERLIRKLLGKVGDGFLIEQPFYCDYGYNIEIGDCFYSNVNLVILDCAKVSIGSHVFLAPNVGIYTAGHPLDAETRDAALEYAKPITIGDSVWIGGGAKVLPGVTIGSGCVIGAGSVVNKDIPPHTLAVGNPCKVIRSLTK